MLQMKTNSNWSVFFNKENNFFFQNGKQNILLVCIKNELRYKKNVKNRFLDVIQWMITILFF